MTTEETIKKLSRDITITNIVLLLTIFTLGFSVIKIKTAMSNLTEKTAEIAQKANVDCQTKTNNVFCIRSVKLK